MQLDAALINHVRVPSGLRFLIDKQAQAGPLTPATRKFIETVNLEIQASVRRLNIYPQPRKRSVA